MKVNFNWFDFEPEAEKLDITFEHVSKKILEGFLGGELYHEEMDENGKSIETQGWWSIER